MTVLEMHIAVQQGVDKIHSLQADSLLSEEIDIELNKNMLRFINTKYGRNNIYRTGFEQSQKRIDDLRTLVREFSNTVTFKEQYGTNLFVDTFQLPYDYMYLVNQRAKIWINGCQPIGYELRGAPLYYFLISQDAFVNNNTSIDPVNPNHSPLTPNGFVRSIDMIDGPSGDLSANVWSPSEQLIASGWTPESYPLHIDAVQQDILSNPGAGFEIFWQQHQNIFEPGYFIVVVDIYTHDWINTDESVGEVTLIVGTPAEEKPSPLGRPLLVTNSSENFFRNPTESSGTKTEGNRFSQQDDIHKLLKDPFNTTKPESPLTTMRGNAIDVYTSDIFIIESLKITYLRKPREISLSLGVDCELPYHTHQEIVAMTVSSILEMISDPRYKTARLEVSQNE
tara:strand:+ start:9272 stop:10456 length:1185 start_codon:yes stop_codon:yes gene_type:complete